MKKIQWLLNKRILNSLVLPILMFSVVFMMTSCAFCNEGHFEKLKHKEFQSGEVTKTKDGKVIFPPNHIFDPETSTLTEIKDKKLFGGVLLNNGRILSINPIKDHPCEQLQNKIIKLLKDSNIDIPENYGNLSIDKKEKIFSPYLKKDPELLKEYNNALETYEKSMYGIISNPKTGEFEYTGKLNIRRVNPHKILLDDERVLLIGGDPVKNLNIPANLADATLHSKHWQIEIFNLKTGMFTLLENNYVPRGRVDEIFKLNNDKLFIISGSNYLFYNLKSNEFSQEKPFLPEWNWNTITKLNDGRLLVFVGPKNKTSYQKIDNAEEVLKLKGTKAQAYYYQTRQYNTMDILIYDPKTDKFSYGGHLVEPRGGDPNFIFQTIVLKDGRVLIYGGEKNIEKRNHDVIRMKSAEIYDPKTKISKPIGNMRFNRTTGDSAILLDDGRVLLYLDYKGVIVYSPNGLVRTTNFEIYIPNK